LSKMNHQCVLLSSRRYERWDLRIRLKYMMVKKHWRYWKLKNIDLTICDWMMPKMTGLELFNTLKFDEKFKYSVYPADRK